MSANLPDWHSWNRSHPSQLYRAYMVSFAPLDIPVREQKEHDLTYEVVDLRVSVIAPAYVLFREVIHQSRPDEGTQALLRSHEPSGTTATVFATVLREVAEQFPGYRRLDEETLRLPVPGLELADGTPPALVTLGHCLFEDGIG